MAKPNGNSKTRQSIKAQTMRELMFASGGRCAMTDCGLPLTSPSGGWIGTVAHIVGAEPGGPRGAGPMAPEQRASVDNLMLMCGTHGREVDAPDTGEAEFPIERLHQMKTTHEAKITEAVAAAIEQDLSGVQTGTGAIDTALRPATDAATAAGLLESLGAVPAAAPQFLVGLEEARADLQRLSKLALDTLSALLELWVQECRLDFGDPSVSGPSLPYQSVTNRVMRTTDKFDDGMKELLSRNFIERVVEEQVENPSVDYLFHSPWQLEPRSTYGGTNFWRSAACFLHQGYGIGIHDWIKGLDFSIFDRVAPSDRIVNWR